MSPNRVRVISWELGQMAGNRMRARPARAPRAPGGRGPGKPGGMSALRPPRGEREEERERGGGGRERERERERLGISLAASPTRAAVAFGGGPRWLCRRGRAGRGASRGRRARGRGGRRGRTHEARWCVVGCVVVGWGGPARWWDGARVRAREDRAQRRSRPSTPATEGTRKDAGPEREGEGGVGCTAERWSRSVPDRPPAVNDGPRDLSRDLGHGDARSERPRGPSRKSCQRRREDSSRR